MHSTRAIHRTVRLPESGVWALRLRLLDMVSCNVLVPQLLWFGESDEHSVVFVLSLLINVGMWLTVRNHRDQSPSDFLPSNWASYRHHHEVATLVVLRALLYLLFDLLPHSAVIAMGR